jgi:hypothetical protein
MHSARHKRQLPYGAKSTQCRSSLVRLPHPPPAQTPKSTEFTPLTFSPRRYFPYWISVASLTILFLGLILWLISQRSLLPGIVIIGSFILFVLWLVGLIVTSIEFWGPTGNVNTECNIFVSGQPTTGPTIETMAWLEQHSICEC